MLTKSLRTGARNTSGSWTSVTILLGAAANVSASVLVTNVGVAACASPERLMVTASAPALVSTTVAVVWPVAIGLQVMLSVTPLAVLAMLFLSML